MINGQREIWIATGNNSGAAIIAASNCGRIMRKNGKIEIASYRQRVTVGKTRARMYMYRFLAEKFIRKTEEDIMKQRNFIDHITHTPANMLINDVRNLRWCTQNENNNFQEAKHNKSQAKIGKKHSAEAKAKMSKAKISKKLSAEHRAKMSAAMKGRRWYNNGIRSVLTNECPPGFVPGRTA